MAGRRFQGDHGCCRDRADGSCALAMVGRLSEKRVGELAEGIWTASIGTVVPARPSPDPRSSRPGASAEAAYRRRRHQEREAWGPGWPRRAGMVAGAAGGVGLLTGLAVGAWVGWQLALLAALLTGWRLRFRPSAATRVWRRQAVMQRATAGAATTTGASGLPGAARHHPAGVAGRPGPPGGRLDRHLGPRVLAARPAGTATQPLVAMACLRRHRRPAALAGGGHRRHPGCRHLGPCPAVAVRPRRHGAGDRPVGGLWVATPRPLADVVRQPPPPPPREIERATARDLAVLRPAA